MATNPAGDFNDGLRFTPSNVFSIWALAIDDLEDRMDNWINNFFPEAAPSGANPFPRVYAFLPKTILIRDLLTNTVLSQDQSGIHRTVEVVSETMAQLITSNNFLVALPGSNYLANYNAAWT